PAGDGAVAELTEAVVSPAVRPIAQGDATAVVAVDVPGGHDHLAEAEPAGNRGRLQAHVERAVTDLAVVIPAPAVGPVVSRHATGVHAARDHPPKTQPAEDEYRLQSLSPG